jgi:RNA polymerase sigma factor (sigma-70 family)
MSVQYVVPPDDFRLLCRIIASTARRGGLSPDNAEEFSQWVHLHLLERGYAPLAQFSGRSSLATFFTVVVRRLLLDWRNAEYGRWRPSSQAKARGPVAIEFERLVGRDGHTRDEAVNIIQHRGRCPDRAFLQQLASLPIRQRARDVSYDDLGEAVPAATFVDPVEEAERRAAAKDSLRQLRAAWNRLPRADRYLLCLRFARSLPVVTIAARLGVAPKPLYRRIERVLETLRRHLTPEADRVHRARPRRPYAKAPATQTATSSLL